MKNFCFCPTQFYKDEAEAKYQQELKSFERRYNKAVKAGVVPRREAEKEVTKRKKAATGKTASASKKGTTKKKTSIVDKVMAALAKDDKLSGIATKG